MLLYGPPGCGKTHVVAAAVAAAGMRFVSVKGPEVLNKYIGASEAAVRDLFRWAPSDEFCMLRDKSGSGSLHVSDMSRQASYAKPACLRTGQGPHQSATIHATCLPGDLRPTKPTIVCRGPPFQAAL